jgi:hypothetical protein
MGQLAKRKGAFPRTVKKPTDQKLAESYLEVLRLREQVRVAQCGRAVPVPFNSLQFHPEQSMQISISDTSQT